MAFVGKDIWLNVERTLLSIAHVQLPVKAVAQAKPAKKPTKPSAFDFVWDLQPYKLVYSASSKKARCPLVATLN